MSVNNFNKYKKLDVASETGTPTISRTVPIKITSGLPPYDISGATFSQSIFTQDSVPIGITWNDDGTKMYEIGAGAGKIYEYDLSTAYDISTATYSQSIDTQDSAPTGITWNDDGSKMYEIGLGADKI